MSSFRQQQQQDPAVMEDELRAQCYELHAARAEVAELLSHQRDVECRYEYLRTVLANLDRNEDHLKKTLAYEAATSDAVLHAAANGQPLPPALAADAATSVLAPPVHLGGASSGKDLFQTPDELARSRASEMAQLRKEIADMGAVIAAERRSIGALQHAMRAQAEWGDAVVKGRRDSNATHKEILQEVAAAQSETRTLAHHEDVLKKRVEAQIHEMNLKTRRLAELDDLRRIYSLQLEELRNAVVLARRDLVRAQTLDAECKHVATVAKGKIDAIAQGRKSGSATGRVGVTSAGATAGLGSFNTAGGSGGDVEALAHAAGPMFVAALGGGGVPGRPVALTGSGRLGDPPHAQRPHELATGTQRYNRNLYGGAAASGRGVNAAAAGNGARHAVSGSPLSAQEQAAAVANAAVQPPFGWTAAPASGASSAPSAAAMSPEQKKQYVAQAYAAAHADANEWLRRYVGSMRGLHLTALETSVMNVQQ